MHTILITVPVQKDKKQELLDLIRSPIGHPFTKTNKGFISAESGFTEDEEGNVVWNLLELIFSLNFTEIFFCSSVKFLLKPICIFSKFLLIIASFFFKTPIFA